MTRKLLLTALLLLCTAVCFSSSYTIRILSADDVIYRDGEVRLSGEVSLEFQDEDENIRRLFSDVVDINTDENLIRSYGNVRLEDDNTLYTCDALSLSWNSMSVVSKNLVTKLSGQKLEFFVTGDGFSTLPEDNFVFITDSILSTRETDPYFSIYSKQLSFVDSDIMIRDAVLRMGRVPVLYLPFFFYPGTTLVFNPSIGLSSARGMFINTTYEVFGRYPGLDNKDEREALFTDLFSQGVSKTTKTGLFYTSEEKKLSWADRTGSFLSIFTDIYEKSGIASGYIGLIRPSEEISVNLDGLLAYDGKLRYAFDTDVSLDKTDWGFDIRLPFYSDRSVRSDYLNRNTAFSLFSMLGSYQEFTKNISSKDDETELSFEGFYRFKGKTNTTEISKLRLSAVYDYDSKSSSYELSSLVLPYVKLSTGGTAFDYSESDRKMRLSYSLKDSFSFVCDRAFSLEKLTEDMDGKLNVELSNKELSFSMSVDPQIRYLTEPSKSKLTQTVRVPSTLTLKIRPMGLTYGLKANLVDILNDRSSVFEFDGSTVKSHYVQFSQDGFELKATLPPQDVRLEGSYSLKKDIFSTKLSASFYPDVSLREKSSLDVSLMLDTERFDLTVKPSYRFGKGLSLTENSVFHVTDDLIFTQDLSTEDFSTLKEMTIGAVYDKSRLSLVFSDSDLHVDRLEAETELDTRPLYFYKDRIGLSYDIKSSLVYDFNSIYSSSLTFDMSLDFAIHDFLDLSLSMKSANTSFFRYQKDGAFDFSLMAGDLLRSLNIFNVNGLRNTGFNLKELDLSLVHYMEDWDLFMDFTMKTARTSSGTVWNPQLSVYIKWRAISDLKVSNSYSGTTGWEK